LEEEKVVAYKGNIFFKEGGEPGVFGNRQGDLALTNRRLVFIKTGALHLGSYQTVEKIEKALKEREGSFAISLLDILEFGADSSWLGPYIYVKYQTEEGLKTCCFWSNTYFDTKEWTRKIFDEANKARMPSPEEMEGGPRDLILVDASHLKYIGREALDGMLEILNRLRGDLGLDEPTVLGGKPKDRVIEEHRVLLPRTRLIIFLGVSDNKFDEEDVKLIKRYVERGGRVFLTVDPPYGPPHRLTVPLGFRFSINVIQDKEHHEGKHKDHIIVSYLSPHPVNEGVKRICFGDYGCFPIHLEDGVNATILARSSPEADPPGAAVAVHIRLGEGEIIAVGQTCLFQGRYMKLEGFDNARWLENILSFLLRSPLGEEAEGAEELPRYCPNCGERFEPGDLYCSRCGHPRRG